MKFKTSALAVTATVAVGLMSSAFADENPYENLGFETNQTFSTGVSGTSIAKTNGDWSGAVPVVSGADLEIDSDSTDRAKFEPTTYSGTDPNHSTVLDFNVEASVVPASVVLTNDTSAQCGFAIKATDDGNVFKVFNGSDWLDATGATMPTAETMFNLKVKLDYRSNPGKVQYLVEGTPLAVNSLTWLPLPVNKTCVSGIDFIGNGKLRNLEGNVLTVVTEIIQINPGSPGQYEVTFSEAQIADLKTKLGVEASAIGTALSVTDPLPNGQTKFNNYVLYGDVVGAETEKPVVIADPSATPSAVNNVVVKVPLFDNVQTVGGVDVTHVLKGSANGADGWTQVGDAKKGNEPQFEIPADSPYRYFKVETTVSPTGK